MATIRDVSKLANVSPGTVSRALNPKKRSSVAPETQAKILKVARQLGYQLPVKKKASQASQSITISPLHFALITTHTIEEEAKDEYWRLVRLGLYKAAEKENVVIDTEIDMHSGVDAVGMAHFDAILVIGKVSMEAITALKSVNPNILVVDGGSEFDHKVDTIGTNFTSLTTSTLDQIATTTKKEIALISGERFVLHTDGTITTNLEDARVRAYHQWIKNNGRNDLFQNIPWTNSAAFEATNALIKSEGARLGAILVTSDSLLAMGVMKGLAENHLVPGKDIALVSYDGMDFTSFLTPALSTIWLPKTELGAAAIIHAKTFHSQIKRTWVSHETIPGKLIYRDTFNLNDHY